jgi:hypothetical protein
MMNRAEVEEGDGKKGVRLRPVQEKEDKRKEGCLLSSLEGIARE